MATPTDAAGTVRLVETHETAEMLMLKLANDTLEKLTGRRLTKVGSDTTPARSEDTTGLEASALRILEFAKGRTMTSLLQQYTTWSAVQYVVQNKIPGAFVECGTWRGGHPVIAAHSLLQAGEPDRDIFIFDTFQGMPLPDDRDNLVSDGTAASDILSRQQRVPGEGNFWCIADRADVSDGMQSTGYPEDRVHLIEGRVEDTIPAGAPDVISVLRLDTDWYESTAHELRHLWSRVTRYGVVIIDDYDWWSGSRRAADEFFAGLAHKPLLFRPGAGRAMIKI